MLIENRFNSLHDYPSVGILYVCPIQTATILAGGLPCYFFVPLRSPVARATEAEAETETRRCVPIPASSRRTVTVMTAAKVQILTSAS
jgi:hypothetical protein